MITVALDTTCMTGGVAILDKGILIAEYTLSVKRTHSERLMSSLDRAMKDASLAPSDIGLIACCIGPGSFTGIRIGVASAKAMAMALGIPLVPVIGLDALCYGLPEGELSYSVIDARHENCFAASYVGTGAIPERLSDYGVMSVQDIAASVTASGKKHMIKGDAAISYREKFLQIAGPLALIPTDEDAIIRPSKVAMCGLKLYEKGLSVTPSGLSPFYIKHAGAQLMAEGKCGTC